MVDYFENTLFDLMVFYKIYGPISLFINVVGIYIIYFKSPKLMIAYKTHLIIHLFWGLLFEVFMTFLTCPFINTPYFMGSTHGILTKWFELDIFYQQILGLSLVQMLLGSVGQLVIHRTQTLLLPTSKWKLSDQNANIAIVVFYLIVAIPLLSIHFFVRKQQNGIEIAAAFIQTHPEYPSLYRNQPLYQEDTELWTGRAHAYLIVYMVLVTVFGTLPMYFCLLIYIRRNRAINDRRHAFRVATVLGIQIIPIVVCYLLPAIWFAFSLFFELLLSSNQIYNDIGCILFSMQSSCSILVAMAAVKPYREYLKEQVGRALSIRSSLVLPKNNGSTSDSNRKSIFLVTPLTMRENMQRGVRKNKEECRKMRKDTDNRRSQ